METIILWIVIIAVGVVFEWVKKKGAGSKNDHPTSGASRPAPFVMPAPFESVPVGPPGVKPKKHKEIAYKPSPDVQSDEKSEEDLEMTLVDLDGDSVLEPEINEQSSTDDTRRCEHFERWRNAIIDTQILERKF